MTNKDLSGPTSPVGGFRGLPATTLAATFAKPVLTPAN
jgi:hypothetical protein